MKKSYSSLGDLAPEVWAIYATPKGKKDSLQEIHRRRRAAPLWARREFDKAFPKLAPQVKRTQGYERS